MNGAVNTKRKSKHISVGTQIFIFYKSFRVDRASNQGKRERRALFKNLCKNLFQEPEFLFLLYYCNFPSFAKL